MRQRKKYQYLTLHQNWYRTPVYFELAVSALYAFSSKLGYVKSISATPKVDCKYTCAPIGQCMVRNMKYGLKLRFHTF